MIHGHAHYMTLALEQARLGLDRGELPIGAVVVNDGAVLASAYTRELAERRRLVHAELLALEEADRLQPYPGRRGETVLYTTLEPCMMCLGAGISFGLGAIHFALEAPSDGAVAHGLAAAPDTNFFPVPEVSSGLLREESRALFRLYCGDQPPGPMREWAETLASL